jgi:hypothetical protein
MGDDALVLLELTLGLPVPAVRLVQVAGDGQVVLIGKVWKRLERLIGRGEPGIVSLGGLLNRGFWSLCDRRFVDSSSAIVVLDRGLGGSMGLMSRQVRFCYGLSPPCPTPAATGAISPYFRKMRMESSVPGNMT